MSGSTSTMKQLYHFVDDLEESLNIKLDSFFDCDEIVLCGVGGSAVSGVIAADCCASESPKIIHLCKYPDLPNWVGPRTLVVVSSYSGNTAETLEMYRQAHERGCSVVAMTSGGKLRSMAVSNGDMLMNLPTGMHPRHAIGYMIGYTLLIIAAAGGPDLSIRVKGFIPKLRVYRDEIIKKDGMARSLVRVMNGHVPVICSESGMKSVPFRWKTQVNENSKFVAFCESSPEFEHMIRAHWSHDAMSGFTLLLMMPFNDYDSDSRVHLEAIVNDMSDDSEVVVVELDGETLLENIFRAIILGDYFSIFWAESRGIDPAEVRPVLQLKAKLAEKGY